MPFPLTLSVSVQIENEAQLIDFMRNFTVEQPETAATASVSTPVAAPTPKTEKPPRSIKKTEPAAKESANEPVVAEKPKVTEICSRDDARKVLIELGAKRDRSVVEAVLAKMDAVKLADVPDTRLGALRDLGRQVMAVPAENACEFIERFSA